MGLSLRSPSPSSPFLTTTTTTNNNNNNHNNNNDHHHYSNNNNNNNNKNSFSSSSSLTSYSVSSSLHPHVGQSHQQQQHYYYASSSSNAAGAVSSSSPSAWWWWLWRRSVQVLCCIFAVISMMNLVLTIRYLNQDNSQHQHHPHQQRGGGTSSAAGAGVAAAAADKGFSPTMGNGFSAAAAAAAAGKSSWMIDPSFSLSSLFGATTYYSSSYHFERKEPVRQWSAHDLAFLNETWDIVYPNAGDEPYTEFAPHINVIWGRGWYNVVPLPPTVPKGFYNDRGRTGKALPLTLLQKYFDPVTICAMPLFGVEQTRYVLMRGTDIQLFSLHILPKMTCNFTLITSDDPTDAPDKIRNKDLILKSEKVIRWYAQDKASEHAKVLPLPLGMPIHYGVKDSPHSLDTVEIMQHTRRNFFPEFSTRKRTIIYDKGTLGGSPRRTKERKEAIAKLTPCSTGPDPIIEFMPKQSPPQFWQTMGQHQFGIVVAGVGWDTFRLWELLFMGTIPIVKASPLDLLLIPAHVPVVIVQDWSEVCTLTGAKYDALVERYQGWVANGHHWLKPSLWLPRNQTHMDLLCDVSPGCRWEIAPDGAESVAK